MTCGDVSVSFVQVESSKSEPVKTEERQATKKTIFEDSTTASYAPGKGYVTLDERQIQKERYGLV